MVKVQGVHQIFVSNCLKCVVTSFKKKNFESEKIKINFQAAPMEY